MYGGVKMPINSWTINLVLAIAIAIIAGGGIYIFKSSVEEATLAQAKLQEMQKQLELQEEYIKDTEANLKESVDIIADLKDKAAKLNERVKGLDVYLDTHKDDKESSEVLKRTIKELSQ